MSESNENSSRDRKLQQALVACIEAAESGRTEDRAAALARYPEFAAELREFFAERSNVERLAEPLRQAPPASAADAPTTGLAEASAPPPGTRVGYFGDYELLEEVGRGGMGVVYKARQVSLKRVVALKMILTGQLADDADVRRFHAEAEAAAKLDHPGIVTVFEVGKHDGHHYFSMAFVEGESLARQLAAGLPPPRRAAELTKKVAEAVSYAHVEGVVHRDLKPANILIDQTGQPRLTDFGLAKRVHGEPGATGDLTATGQVLGTPSYMPPEQASGQRGTVGPLSDVYSLGAVLYSMLTGRPPFQAATALDTLLQVLDQEPVSPRQLNATIPRDLETICLKCLAKEPDRRYSSARELVADLDRFLTGQPIQARPTTRRERVVKWIKRRPTAAALLGVSLAAVIGFVALGIGLVVNARRLADAERERGNLLAVQVAIQRSHVYSSDLALAALALDKQNPVFLQESLNALRPKPGEPDLRGFEWFYLWQQISRERLSLPTFTLNDHRGPALGRDRRRLVYSPDGKLIATPKNVCDAATGKVLISYDEVAGERIFFSGDSQFICAGGKIRPVSSKEGDQNAGIDLPQAPQGKELRDINNVLIFPKKPRPLGFLGNSLVVLHHVADPWVQRDEKAKKWRIEHIADTTVKSLDAATGKETVYDVRFRKGYRIVAAALCEKNGLLAVASAQPDFSDSWNRKDEVEVWDLSRPGQQTRKLFQFDKLGENSRWSNGDLKELLFSPDGSTLAVATRDGNIRLCDPETGKARVVLDLISGPRSLIFSQDSKTLLALRMHDFRLKVWNVATGKELFDKPIDRYGWSEPVAGISPDGATVAMVIIPAGESGVIQLWDMRTGKLRTNLVGHRRPVRDFAFAPDGKTLAALDAQARSPTTDAHVKLWDLVEEKPIGLPVDASAITTFEQSPDGNSLAVGFVNGKVQFCEAHSLKVMSTLGVVVQDSDPVGVGQKRRSIPRKSTAVHALKSSPDGKLLAVSHRGNVKEENIDVWDVAGGKVVASFPGFLVGFDGKIVATVPTFDRYLGSPSPPDPITLWDVATKERLLEVKDAYERVFGMTRDGLTAATATVAPYEAGRGHYRMKVWSTASGKEVPGAFESRGNSPSHIIFAPNGKLLAMCNSNLEVRRPGAKQADFPSAGRFYDLATGKTMVQFPLAYRYGESVGDMSNWTMAEFSADSKRLVTVANDGDDYRAKVSIWDTATGKEMATAPNPEKLACVHAALSPDGKTLAMLTMGEWRCDHFPDGNWLPEGKIVWKKSSPSGVGMTGGSGELSSMHPVYQLHLWDVSNATVRERHRVTVGWQGTVEAMAFSGDGQSIYILANLDEKIYGGVPTVNHLRAWDVATGQERGSIGDGGTRFHALTYGADGRLLALTDQRLNERRPKEYPSLYKIRTWEIPFSFDFSRGDVRELASPQTFTATELPVDLDPKSLKAAINTPPKEDAWSNTFNWGSHDSTAISRDAKVKAVRTFSLPIHAPGPGGKTKITPSPTDVRIIDNATGEVRHVLKGFGQWVTRLAFTPDGKTLAMGDYHGRIKLWNVAAGRELLTIPAHGSAVTGLAFRGDGRMLASCSDVEIRLWRAEANE